MADGRGHLVGVFGPFGNRALVELSTEDARRLVDEGELEPQPAFLLDAVAGELDALRVRAPELADSALAGAARVLAYELSNPHNSATSKAACARELREALDRLRELAPAKPAADRLDEVTRKREDRRRRRSAKT